MAGIDGAADLHRQCIESAPVAQLAAPGEQVGGDGGHVRRERMRAGVGLVRGLGFAVVLERVRQPHRDAGVHWRVARGGAQAVGGLSRLPEHPLRAPEPRQRFRVPGRELQCALRGGDAGARVAGFDFGIGQQDPGEGVVRFATHRFAGEAAWVASRAAHRAGRLT